MQSASVEQLWLLGSQGQQGFPRKGTFMRPQVQTKQCKESEGGMYMYFWIKFQAIIIKSLFLDI